jgi:hypothetical protein
MLADGGLSCHSVRAVRRMERTRSVDRRLRYFLSEDSADNSKLMEERSRSAGARMGSIASTDNQEATWAG